MNNESAKKLESVLIRIMDEMRYLNIDSKYHGVNKAINILKNSNVSGYKNISSCLLSDGRKLYDNRDSSERLDFLFDQAYELSDKMS
ncbi:MAG: hypothetical protein ABW131_09435 [Candidatus Sedimenticola sp. 6PFRAG5]